MAKEIERKFLVCGDSFIDNAVEHRHIIQGYLSTDPDRTVRVRIADGNAWITVKTRNVGATRNEWEFPVDAAMATEVLRAAAKGRIIEKTRYLVPAEAPVDLWWEVDVFEGAHQGLIVAEIELPSEDTPFTIPPFIGEEVTGNPAYYNSSLSSEA